jgi:hypothetical protein
MTLQADYEVLPAECGDELQVEVCQWDISENTSVLDSSEYKIENFPTAS